MGGNSFRFKQFEVNQELCAMKVGTDGVLIGAWCDVAGKRRVLDIGTGTGLISLMVAQRNAEAVIESVEIDADASLQAAANFSDSPWADRLSVTNMPFEEFVASGENKYDLIVSNPPYFENSLKAASDSRTNARHTDSLSFYDLIRGAESVLEEDGVLALVYPADSDEKIRSIAGECGLKCRRATMVRGNDKQPVKRVLAEFARECSGDVQETELVVEIERHVYSLEYIGLTRDFYLKM